MQSTEVGAVVAGGPPQFLGDGRICISSNPPNQPSEGSPSAYAVGCSPDPSTAASADVYSLIVTVKLNDVDPRDWLAHVLRTTADQPVSMLDEVLPRTRRKRNIATAAA